MFTRLAVVAGCLMVAGLVIAACTQAQEIRGVKIGDPAPDWKDIEGVDGKKHSLSDYKDAKVIVLVCTCNHCPVAVAYEDRLIQFQKDYKDKGVQLIAFNVNNIPEDRLDKMIERAKQKGFNFPYIYDPTQKMARDYGARVTPHFFVLDQERKVRYIGSMDDNQNPAKVTRNYLRDAVDAILAGKPVPVPETKAFGCTVKYE
ncbi:MAG: thioredoxin family protein [Thermoguttaceae bacterium]|nr:thioredoxin family protein [Thermoguttaceae bacterium]MDW8077985.1 thioredoxin family protein [Thermoguttaceae bacterium]